ncbi:MAG: hypothetical protein JOY99_07835 [Sphingomonadaceae bacterium]|nr:hypothetical protein [Sphingomonadaceae bacterium]
MTSTEIIIAAIVLVIVIAAILLVARRKPADRIEGDGVGDEIAAAVENIAGEFLGVDAHHDRATDGLPPPPPHSGHPSTIALEPAPTVVPADADEAGLPDDDLTRLKGLGPKAAALLGELGIRRYAQLAALDAAGIARVDAAMGNFKGRITRDRWIDQARFLAAGDIAGFEAQFGKLG